MCVGNKLILSLRFSKRSGHSVPLPGTSDKNDESKNLLLLLHWRYLVVFKKAFFQQSGSFGISILYLVIKIANM